MTRVNMTTAEWLINAGNPTKWPQPVKKCTKNEYLDTVLEYEPEKVEYRTLLYNKRWRTARVEWFPCIWPDTRVRVEGKMVYAGEVEYFVVGCEHNLLLREKNKNLYVYKCSKCNYEYTLDINE